MASITDRITQLFDAFSAEPVRPNGCTAIISWRGMTETYSPSFFKDGKSVARPAGVRCEYMDRDEAVTIAQSHCNAGFAA